MEILKRIDYKKVLLVAVLGFICFNIASFDIISLQIQSERLNKRICIQEMIPSMPPLSKRFRKLTSRALKARKPPPSSWPGSAN